MTKYKINKKDVPKLKTFISETYKGMKIHYTYSTTGFSIAIEGDDIAFYSEYIYSENTDFEIFN